MQRSFRETYFGWSRESSGVEVPDKVDFYQAKDAPMGTFALTGTSPKPVVSGDGPMFTLRRTMRRT